MTPLLSSLATSDALTAWGFPVRRLGIAASVRLFQAGYVGDPAHPVHLAVDGVVGPATSAALRASDGHASAHFTWLEMTCKCGGRYTGCRRIWVTHDLVVAAEALRAKVYPDGLEPVSVCRCEEYHQEVYRRLGRPATTASLHLVGKAMDVPARITPDQLRARGLHGNAAGQFGGVGYSRSTGQIVHLDVRRPFTAPFIDGA